MTALGSFDFLMWSVGLAEGGYANHPQDRGGETRYGITQPFLDEYCALTHLPKLSVRVMSRETARDCYYRLIWCGTWVRGREVSQLAPQTGFVYCDAAILHGRVEAARMLQREIGTPVDGKVGPQTLTDLLSESRQRSDVKIAEGVLQRRRELIESIVARDASQMVFYHGWRNRLNDVARRADVRWRWTYLSGDSDDAA